MLNSKDVLSLAGKVAIITGGASGIGLASAERLAEFGATVVIIDVNEALGKEAEQKINRAGGKAEFIKCDVRNARECQSAVDQVKEKYGRIDILFNNAGVVWRRTVVESTEEEWDQVVDVSLKGAFLMSKYAIPVMAAGGGGSIINTGSGWGMKGGNKAASYCAAKGGLVNLTKAMAIDHGPQNIRVNCVCPGDTDTPLLRGESVQLGIDCAQMYAESAQERPLRRMGVPEDIANAVLFLASDLSTWITGAALVVDGGGIA